MRYLLALIGSLVALNAADVTLTYTPAQLKGVQWKVNRMNQDAFVAWLAANPGANTNAFVKVTPLGYVQTLFTAKLDNILAEAKRSIAAEVAAKYDASDAATQTEVETTLGVDRNDD